MTGTDKPRGAEPVHGLIQIVPYDPAWPKAFERIARRIGTALGDRAIAVEHVGSTSVPGLAAKPVIDVNLLVADTRDEAAYVPALEAAGFRFVLREPDWFEHRLFKGVQPSTNLHVFPDGCPEHDTMMLFADWLRHSREDFALYLQTKCALAEKPWRKVQDYADAKHDVVTAIMARARAWEAGAQAPVAASPAKA